ncbi:unnamed protein product [Rotaria sp. Silwood1]|nr:unnamed protein product [Rotaria sp. Silwood1]CAF1593080.1 unnamed protein product [Rotaria sp. Silwood1]
MGCSASEVSNSLSQNPQYTVTPLSSSSTLNQQPNSNRRPKRDYRIDTNEIIQNFLLIWLDENIDESSDDYLNSIEQLRRTINTIEIFHDTNECIDYMSQVQNEKSFLIISGALCESVVSRIHDTIQLHSIYVFCQKQEKYEEWAKNWSKVKGIFTEITSVCDAVRQSARQCDQDDIGITGVSSLNQIEPSFMYTQLLKEIILEIDFDEQKEIKDLVEQNIMMATIPTLQENNLESIYLIWLDAVVDQSQENIDAQQQIRSIINHLKTFQNIQDCEKYINQISKDDRILLIVSGQLGQEIVPRIHYNRQIFSIYVYCMNKVKNEEWAKHFPKIKGIITELNDLLNQIQLDHFKRIENKVDEPFIINISKFNNNNNNIIDKSTKELNGEFLYSQLLMDCLLRMKSNLTDKNEFINLCKKFYENNSKELNLIKEFEKNYSSNQVLWWYTRDSFIYRLLNKALRIQNIDLLFVFRFIIYDIEKQLKLYQCSSSIRVYRGQLMSIDELNQLKISIGEYISINSFLSTSLNRQQAIKFLNEYNFSHNLQKILFEIDANPYINNLKSFANISSKSFYSNEQEILFMFGSIFRLINIKQDNNGIWIIQMILSNHNNENLKILYDNIKNEYIDINNEISLLSFGNILYQMGKYDLAEKYFQRLLKDLSNNHDDISKCYYSLGVLALIKDNYDLSLNYHEKSLKLLKPNDSRLADSYHCIACIYQKKEYFKNALEYYNKALNIWYNKFGEDYYQIADCLSNMGCLNEKEENYSKALEYHQKALKIRKKLLPKDHSDFGASYNNIGNIYLYLHEYDLALENYEYSLKIKIKSLPIQHSSIATTLENIGLVYEEKKLFEKSLEYYKKAANIFRETFSSNHSNMIDIEQSIKRISSILESQILTTYF